MTRELKPTPPAGGYDPDIQALCQELSRRIGMKYPAKPDPVITPAWLEDMRRLVQFDGRSVDQVLSMIRWATQDAFWSRNIRSPYRLRMHWEMMADSARRQHTRRLEEPVSATATVGKPVPAESWRDPLFLTHIAQS